MRQIDTILELMAPSLSKKTYKQLENVLETVLMPSHVNKSNEEVIRSYLNHCKYLEKTESTIIRVEISLNDLSKNLRTPIIDADSHDLLEYFKQYKDTRHVTARTMNTVMAYVNGLYSFLYREEWIAYNPMVKIEKIREPKIIKPSFTEKEIHDLRIAMKDNPRDRAIFEFMLATGIRRSELVTLKISDVNFERKRVFIRQGKGRKDRITFFNNYSLKHLVRYLELRTKRSDDSYLFTKNYYDPSKKSKIIYSEDKLSGCRLYSIFKEYGEITGIKDCHPHKCRHYCITKLIKQGMRPELVANQVGHSDISTTLNVYTNIDPLDVESEYRKAMGMNN